jgi:acyl-CoA oxidase
MNILVTRNGEYLKPPHSKLNYSSMVVVRVDIVTRSFPILAKAITIAIRFSVVNILTFKTAFLLFFF